MLFGRVLCLFNRHRPQRRNVVWDGFHYTSDCTHCGKPVFRRSGGGWRSVDELEGGTGN
jgi:hypothetical protein